MPALHRRARPGNGPPRRRQPRPRQARQPLLRPRIRQEPSSRAPPVLRIHGANRPGSPRGHRLPVQRAGFIDYPHRPYLTCWIALDDMTEANGTVYLLPYSRAGTRDVIKHGRDEESNDLVGYFGHDPGDAVIVPAGSIACFSSTLFHRSGPNTTDRVRRVYVAQYSAEPIFSEDGSHPLRLAEPLLVEGKRVS